jgi:hypothetical protein
MKRFTLLFAALVAASSIFANTATLRLNLNKGDEAKFRTENNQTITQSIQGTQQVTLQKQVVDYKMVVTEKEANGNVLASITYTRFFISMNANGQDFSFDSDVDKTSQIPTFSGLGAMVGKSFQVKYSTFGEVVEVSGTEAMFESILNELSAGNEGMKEQMKAMLAESFTGDAMKQMIDGGAIIFPEKAINVKDSWSSNKTMKNQVVLNVMSTYNVKSIENGSANITVASTIATPPDSKMKMMGTEMQFTMFGTQEGNTIVDLKTGLTTESNAKQNLSGSITANMGGQTLNIPMTIVSEAKTVIVK